MSDLFFKEASKLQEDYAKLVRKKKLTKQAMCDLCVPFRDKYHLSDMQVLQIARKEVSLAELVKLSENFID